MQFSLVFMCGVVLLSLSSVIRGDDDFSGNGELDDMVSPASNNILVHNTFHLSPRDQKPTIDVIDDQADNTQTQESANMGTAINSPFNFRTDRMKLIEERANMRTAINSPLNFRTDHMKLMEERIDTLIQSNKHIVNMISTLDAKVDRILQTDNLRDERSSPKSNIEFMDSLEISNKLNNIQQYITSSSQVGCRTIRPDLLDPYQIDSIKHFMTAIGNANKSLRNFTPNAFNQVLLNSRRTMQSLEKVTNMVQVIDERTRRYDGSSRQFEDVGSNYRGWTSNNSLNNKPCRNGRSRRLNKNAAAERTYRNLKRSTGQVHFEPNSYNCHDLKVRRNGVYKFASQDEVANEAGRFFYERYCEFNTDGVAWTVIQRRNDNQENFNRTWLDYKLGFGELDKEFWFGNDFIHKLTSDEDVELRIILEDNSGRQEWAEYSLFQVEGEELNYNLEIGGYRGSIPDGFLYHNDQDFSTYDRQNDNSDNISCASSYGNGWWFNNCTDPSNRDYKGIIWENWLGSNFLKSSRMMIRPKGLWSGEDGNEKEEYIYTSTSIDP